MDGRHIVIAAALATRGSDSGRAAEAPPPTVGASTLQYALRVQIANGLYQLSAACATESIPPSQTWRFDDNLLWGHQSVFCYFVKPPVFGNWWEKDNALAVSLAVVQRVEQTYDSSGARRDAEWLLNDVARRLVVPMAPRYVLFALLSCDHLPTSIYATLLNGLFFSSDSTNGTRPGKVPGEEEENNTTAARSLGKTIPTASR
jgi:hypothetical protein